MQALGKVQVIYARSRDILRSLDISYSALV